MPAAPAVIPCAGMVLGAVAGEQGWIAEGEIAKFDFAARDFAWGNRREAVVNLRLRIEDVVETTHGSGAALKDIGDPAEGDHGPDELREVSVERDERAERKAPAQEQIAAGPEHDQERNPDQRLKRGHEQAPGANQLDVARDVLAIGFIEAADFRLFLRIRADNANSGEILLNACGQRGQRRLNSFV